MINSTPANDTAALTIGTTLETALWRAHRYSGAIRLTALGNAGKRGRKCLHLSLVGRDAELEPVAAWIAAAVWADASEALMADMLADVALAGLGYHRTELRGVDVHPEPEIDVRGDLVRATLTSREAMVTHTAVMGSGLRHDSHLRAVKPADAAKAYAWAKAHPGALGTMDRAGFLREMDRIGARFTW